MKFLYRLIPPYQLTLVVTVIILYLTLLPKPFGEEDLPLFPGADKIAHCCMFGGLALTYIFERNFAGRRLSVNQALLACLIVTIFGITVEIAQSLMAIGRSGDLADIMADAIGAFGAFPVCYLLHWINVVVKHRP